MFINSNFQAELSLQQTRESLQRGTQPQHRQTAHPRTSQHLPTTSTASTDLPTDQLVHAAPKTTAEALHQRPAFFLFSNGTRGGKVAGENGEQNSENGIPLPRSPPLPPLQYPYKITSTRVSFFVYSGTNGNGGDGGSEKWITRHHLHHPHHHHAHQHPCRTEEHNKNIPFPFPPTRTTLPVHNKYIGRTNKNTTTIATRSTTMPFPEKKNTTTTPQTQQPPQPEAPPYHAHTTTI